MEVILWWKFELSKKWKGVMACDVSPVAMFLPIHMICFPSFTGMFEPALHWRPTVVTTCFWLLVTWQLHGWSRLWSLSATFEQNLTGLCYLPEQCWHFTKALPLALSNHRSISLNWQWWHVYCLILAAFCLIVAGFGQILADNFILAVSPTPSQYHLPDILTTQCG